MASYKDMERMAIKRSRCDDVMPRLPALASNSHEGHPQEVGPALKSQPRKIFKSFRTISSSDFHPSTLKRVVTDDDISSESEDGYKYSPFEPEHDSRESSSEPTVGGNSSGSEDGSGNSLDFNVPTTYRRTPRLTLRMLPTSTFNHFSNSTFYDGDTSYKPQLLPREVSVETLNQEHSELMTPRLYQLSAGSLSPPPAPKQIKRKDDIIVTCIPTELCLPLLY